MTIGALTAVVGAQKDITSPWRELLTYYQSLYDVKIKYEQVVAQFDAPGRQGRAAFSSTNPTQIPRLAGELRVSNLSVHGEGGEHVLDGITFSAQAAEPHRDRRPCGQRQGGTHPGAGRPARAIERPSVHRRHRPHAQPEAVLGRRIGYVGNPTMIFAGSIEDNLLYGLKQRPQRPRPDGEDALSRYEREMLEAHSSGNSPHDPQADWIDYAAAGIERAGGPCRQPRRGVGDGQARR